MNWHGFSDHLDAIKAFTWIVGIGWAVVLFGLDARYASKNVEGWARETYEITLEASIEQMVSRLCAHPDDVARRDLNRRLQELVRKYLRAFDQSPYIPTCANGEKHDAD